MSNNILLQPQDTYISKDISTIENGVKFTVSNILGDKLESIDLFGNKCMIIYINKEYKFSKWKKFWMKFFFGTKFND